MTASARALVVAGALVASSLWADAALAQQGFPAKRFPFVPRVVQDRNPSLCAIALQDARARFNVVAPDTKVAHDNRHGMTWLEWEEAPDLSFQNETVSRLVLDLDGDGRRQVLLYRSFVHSWRGNNYYAYLVPSRQDLKKLMLDPEGLDSVFGRLDGRRSQQAVPNNIVRYYPDARLASTSTGEPISTGTDWEEHRLFRWRNRYYFYDESNDWGRMEQRVLTVYRLQGDGRVDPQCKIQVIPDDAVLKNFRRLPGMASFLKILTTIGAGGPDCGSMHSGYVHEGGAKAAIDRAAYRPWAVSRAPGSPNEYYGSGERSMGLIEDWSFEEIWNRREYQTFLEHIDPAKKAMERYLALEFGLSPKDARAHSQRVIEDLIAAWVLVPNNTGVRSPLTAAILEYDEDSLRQEIETFDPRGRFGQIRAPSDYLHDAVEWVAGMDILLSAGTEPNYPKGLDFGFRKTPLMTAAHMNRPDTVRLLLKHGADPNLRTAASSNQCGLGMERGSRSALMYAAENAGPEVMKLLLDAGADPEAKDSKGNGIGFYLAMNPRLSEDQKRMDIRAFVQSSLSASRSPGFDCAKAAEAVEKQICGDEILRMMDGEMAAAFMRWQRAAGAEARNDQRRWLRERNEACRSIEVEKDMGCLQQMTRARVRYLHNRIEELSQAAAAGVGGK
jgi:uncharacterized protein